MPSVPIPLVPGVSDAELDLQLVFEQSYNRAGFEWSIDYRAPVKPALDEVDVEWVSERVRERDKSQG
jgi:hypothetical protein